MHPLQKQFHDFIQKQKLLKEDDQLLLAVSGGMDSMVMAHLFLASHWKFSIAHCNFNLRGDESDGDEAFVKDWAKKNEIPIHIKRFDLPAGSTQLNSRNARFEWFEELSMLHGYQKTVLAHHLNDSLETTLINLVRGTGAKGLAGVKPISGSLIRPLLFASREAIESYAKEAKIQWREDSSNATDDYDRNYIRHEVIPKLQTLNESLVGTFHDTSERLRLTNEWLQGKAQEISNEFLVGGESKMELQLDWLKTESDQIILAEVLSTFKVNWTTVKEIYDARGKSGKNSKLKDMSYQWIETLFL